MLTDEQNETLTRVGAGTPMGELMRRYWIPTLLSWELPDPDCPPVEVRLLGEDLVAFRQTDGQVGMVSAYCAHRRANLFWGRNEENGIRCVYHGWKFDVEGRCVDMPSEPATSNFKDKVQIPAYATYETGDVIWTYMGPPAKKPAPPLFPWTQVPETYRGISKIWQECNWLQALEGGIDTVHSNFLHGGRPPGLKYDESTTRGRANNVSRAADVEVVPTDYGYSYAGIRSMPEDTNFVRGYHWVMPWNQIRGYTIDPERARNDGHMWVPVDDHNTIVFNWTYTLADEPLSERERSLAGTGNQLGVDIDINNNFRSLRNVRNKYQIDRQVQKTQTFSGISGTNTQDRAIQESMGAIADRTLERLGTTDRAIITARRLLLKAVKTVEDGGDPPGIAPSYYRLRAGERVIPKGANWFEEMKGWLFSLEEPAEQPV
jgi:phthalate 4,5-dioxygenase oxygenase subunit